MEIGFDRTASGSDAVSQYAAPVRDALGAAPGTPGALLAPGLGGRHRDLTPAQGRGGPATAGREVGGRRLVQQRLVELLGEQR